MKILLVDLPTVLPTAVARPRIQPPLWAAYLTSYKAVGIVNYLDARAENGASWKTHDHWQTWGLANHELVEQICVTNSDVVGIHIGVSTELGVATELVELLKKRSKARILLGGPGIALVPIEFLPHGLSEVEICRTVGFGKLLGMNLFVSSPDINVLPHREIWWDRYEEVYQSNGNFHSGPPLVSPSLQLETSVGCGAQCEFCATRGTLIRRSLESVKAELEWLRAHGIAGVHFEDDNILAWTNTQVQEALPYLNLAVDLGFRAIEFPNGITVRGMLSPLFLAWCDEALEKGVSIKLALPFESASDGLLTAVFKPHRREHCDTLAEKLLPLVSKGLIAEVFLQIGFHIVHKDGHLEMENDESISKTLQWADKLNQQGFQVNCWFNSPIPGTPLFAPWRRSFPDAQWEELLFSIPSRFYPEEYRKELERRAKGVNTARRAAAFQPATSPSGV